MSTPRQPLAPPAPKRLPEPRAVFNRRHLAQQPRAPPLPQRARGGTLRGGSAHGALPSPAAAGRIAAPTGAPPLSHSGGTSRAPAPLPTHPVVAAAGIAGGGAGEIPVAGGYAGSAVMQWMAVAMPVTPKPAGMMVVAPPLGTPPYNHDPLLMELISKAALPDHYDD